VKRYNRWIQDFKQLSNQYHADPESTLERMKKNISQDLSNAPSFYVYTELMKSGPKIFAPTPNECEALGRVSLNVPWQDYRQPFESFAVVFPDDYLKNKFNLPAEKEPGAVVSCYRPKTDKNECIFFAGIIGAINKVSMWFYRAGVDSTPEEMMSRIFNTPVWGDCDLREDYQLELMPFCLRVFFNSCLLLAQCGTKKIGYANPEYAAKLQEKNRKANLPEMARKNNTRELAMLPIVYGFDQHIRLFDTEGPASGHGGDGARTLHPHWRRGHWRNQPHGPKNELRKLMFVRPCFVNSHLFAGNPMDARVAMTASIPISGDQQ